MGSAIGFAPVGAEQPDDLLHDLPFADDDAHFAPLVRLTYERNVSSIELFDYRRLRTEFGLARAF